MDDSLKNKINYKGDINDTNIFRRDTCVKKKQTTS